MICKECGTKLTPEQTTCPNCGALQQQAVPKKRKKSDTASQQNQPQSDEVQMQWQDRLILGATVLVTLAAIAWLIFMLMKPADGNDQPPLKQCPAPQRLPPWKPLRPQSPPM